MADQKENSSDWNCIYCGDLTDNSNKICDDCCEQIAKGPITDDEHAPEYNSSDVDLDMGESLGDYPPRFRI